DRVLQHAWDAVVVLGRGNQQRIRLSNGVAQLHDARRGASRFDILVVQRDPVQLVNHDVQGRRCKVLRRAEKRTVVGTAAQTAGKSNNVEHGSDCGRIRSNHHSASTRWRNETAMEPSPTADATRLTLPHRTSPTANTPGREVSSRYGKRSRGHFAAARSSGVKSGPVLINPFESRVIQPSSQAVLATAPVIRNTCLIF